MPPGKRRRKSKKTSSEEDENAIQNNLLAGVTSTFMAMEESVLTCTDCGLKSILPHRFSTKNGSNSECRKCLHKRINESAMCSICDELKPSKDFIKAEREKKDSKCCRGCMAVPVLPTNETTLDMLNCIAKVWNCSPGSQQTDDVISACKLLLSEGVDMRAIIYFIRKESFKNDPITTPYFQDAIKSRIYQYLRKHLSPTLFRVVAKNERVPHPPNEHSAMTDELNTLLELDAATGMNNTTLSRDFGNLTRDVVKIFCIELSAIEVFQSMNFQEHMFDVVEDNFIEQHQLTLKMKRSRLDTIINNARAVDSSPEVYLSIIQKELHSVLKEQHPKEERTEFFFYSGVNYFAGKHCPPEVITEMMGSSNPLLLDILKSAMAIKCGHSSKDLRGQFDKAMAFMTHNPGKWGSVVIGVPIGSTTSSFANEQAEHLHLFDDHVYGEHYDIANKLNIVIEHFLNATNGKVISVGTVGESKSYITPPVSNNDGPGEVYEYQRIANAAVRKLMRSFQSQHVVASPSNNWYLTELATKCGSSFLDSKHQKDSASMDNRRKSIEAYLRVKCFWSSPYSEIVVVSHESKHARADEAEFHSHLHNSVAHVSGESFDAPGNITEGTSMLRSFLEQKGSAVNEMVPVTVKNSTSTQYYNKQALQQYIQSGIVSRDHILKLWAGGIIERC